MTSPDPTTAVEIPRVSWPDTMRAMNWQQGQHVTLIGPTGRGKTEALVRLLEQRRYVIFLGTKRRDDTQDKLASMGYHTVKTAQEIEPNIYQRIILRPTFPKGASARDIRGHHHRVFREGIMRAFRQTNWTVAIDEARYLCDFLGLTSEVNLLLLQGRSQGNSVVAGTQRPRYIPLEFYDQADHFFLWRDNDRGNTARVEQMIGQHREALAALQTAGFHDTLYVNDRTGRAMFTNTRWESSG